MGSNLLLKNASGDGILTYCIFDSDYHSMEVIQARYSEAKARGISLHIWQLKELENYVLIPCAVHRAIHSQLADGVIGPTVEDVELMMRNIAEELRQDVIDCIATHIQSVDRKLAVSTANQRAREVVANRWKNLQDRLGIIPGKDALSRLSHWAQEKYKVTVSGLLISYHMIPGELHPEMQDILMAIEKGEPFPERMLSSSTHGA